VEALTEQLLEAHGGVVHLGSHISPFSSGLPLSPPFPVAFRDCYIGELAKMSGVAPADAESLFAALREQTWYLPGAQFAVGRAAMFGRGAFLSAYLPHSHPSPTHSWRVHGRLLAQPALLGWVRSAAALLSAPNMSDSASRGYDTNNCCSPCPKCGQFRRSCLPWLWERLWVLDSLELLLLMAVGQNVDYTAMI